MYLITNLQLQNTFPRMYLNTNTITSRENVFKYKYWNTTAWGKISSVGCQVARPIKDLQQVPNFLYYPGPGVSLFRYHCSFAIVTRETLCSGDKPKWLEGLKVPHILQYIFRTSRSSTSHLPTSEGWLAELAASGIWTLDLSIISQTLYRLR